MLLVDIQKEEVLCQKALLVNIKVLVLIFKP